MAHIIIDGYNYISRNRVSRLEGVSQVDTLRQSLLEKLTRYKRQKGGRITVVFDAYKSLSLGRQQENYKGIEVVYSRVGETADDVMIGWIRERRAGMVIVSSDREIIDAAKQQGIPFITPVRMEELMAEATAESYNKVDEEEARQTKKGNPRRLPKKLRKVVKTIEKISR